VLTNTWHSSRMSRKLRRLRNRCKEIQSILGWPATKNKSRSKHFVPELIRRITASGTPQEAKLK
jgi:hypothetical protein